MRSANTTSVAVCAMPTPIKRASYLSRKIPDGKSDKRGVGNVLLGDLVGALKKEGLVGRHLVEDYLLDRRFAAPVRENTCYKPVNIAHRYRVYRYLKR